MTDEKPVYPRSLRAVDLEPHYCRHVSAMTTEQLHSKADIAEQLAWRDQVIEQLRARVGELEALLQRWRLEVTNDGALWHMGAQEARITDLESQLAAVAHAVGVEHAPDTGPTHPGPFEAVLAAVTENTRKAGQHWELESQLDAARSSEGMLRALIALLDRDGGQKQAGESLVESCARASHTLVAERHATFIEHEELAAAREAAGRRCERCSGSGRVTRERTGHGVAYSHVCDKCEGTGQADEQALEARVREVLGDERCGRLHITRPTHRQTWVAVWNPPGLARQSPLKATGDTLPALLRAILEVEKGGPDEG